MMPIGIGSRRGTQRSLCLSREHFRQACKYFGDSEKNQDILILAERICLGVKKFVRTHA